MHTDRELTAAPVTPLVLRVLSESENYGYAILKQVGELAGANSNGPTPWSTRCFTGSEGAGM